MPGPHDVCACLGIARSSLVDVDVEPQETIQDRTVCVQRRRGSLGALTISGPRYRFDEASVKRMLSSLGIFARKLTSDFGGDAEWLPQIA